MFPTYEQILTITKFVASSSNIVFVSSRFVAGMKKTDSETNNVTVCD
jgi:hypothetical protein